MLNPIKNIPNIPIEILSKYYARIYTFDGMFYKDIKYDLLKDENAKYTYLPYIKTLYEGVENGGLKVCSEMELYSAAHFSEQEIEDLKYYKQNRRLDLPMSVIFSKSFMSFSKTKEGAKSFYLVKKM